MLPRRARESETTGYEPFERERERDCRIRALQKRERERTGYEPFERETTGYKPFALHAWT